MKKEGKKGQFYLIASILIVGVVIGFAVIMNYVVYRPLTKDVVVDLTKELNLESEKVVDYGLLTDSAIIIDSLDAFVDAYGDWLKEDNELIFVYGDEDGFYAANYFMSDAGEVTLGGSSVEVKVGKKEKLELPETAVDNRKLSFKVKDEEYEYDFDSGGDGYKFFVVIEQPKD